MESVNEYRIGSNVEPTDEQIAVILQEAAELARESSRKASEYHLRKLKEAIG